MLKQLVHILIGRPLLLYDDGIRSGCCILFLELSPSPSQSRRHNLLGGIDYSKLLFNYNN